jgi:hypothetical protein
LILTIVDLGKKYLTGSVCFSAYAWTGFSGFPHNSQKLGIVCNRADNDEMLWRSKLSKQANPHHDVVGSAMLTYPHLTLVE